MIGGGTGPATGTNATTAQGASAELVAMAEIGLADRYGLPVSVALLACWLPARRAVRVDPVEALRHE